jgi:hypothetical protein
VSREAASRDVEAAKKFQEQAQNFFMRIGGGGQI